MFGTGTLAAPCAAPPPVGGGTKMPCRASSTVSLTAPLGRHGERPGSNCPLVGAQRQPIRREDTGNEDPEVGGGSSRVGKLVLQVGGAAPQGPHCDWQECSRGDPTPAWGGPPPNTSRAWAQAARVTAVSRARRGEREGVLQPCRCPGVRAVSAAGPGQEKRRPAPGRRRRPHPCVQARLVGWAAGS